MLSTLIWKKKTTFSTQFWLSLSGGYCNFGNNFSNAHQTCCLMMGILFWGKTINYYPNNNGVLTITFHSRSLKIYAFWNIEDTFPVANNLDADCWSKMFWYENVEFSLVLIQINTYLVHFPKIIWQRCNKWMCSFASKNYK